MDFSSVHKEASDFLAKSQCGLKITHVDEESSQIHLASMDSTYTFYISCPNADNSSWNVWSDNDDSQQALQYVMDSCDLDSCSSVTAVLERVSKSLKTASGLKSCKSKAANGAHKAADDDDNDDGDGDDDDEGIEDVEDLDDYYAEEDFDAEEDEETRKASKEREDEEKLAANFFNSTGSETAIKRLVKDLKAISKESANYGIVATPKGNNLFVWEVKLTDIPVESKLGCDLADYAKRYRTEPVIYLDMQFPSEYPFQPPFIRVVKPRFKFLTGHVTIGGSICMQMLTQSGWRPTNDIESILVQVRAEILSDPKASLDMSHSDREYSESEARVAFQRMVQKYGW